MNGLINRQYVGARYVPKIMGEWNKALQYEALSVVTYMGNSFTSKIPVPSNIDITNEKYWINTANYNAQVEEYRKETEKITKEFNYYKNYVTPEMFGAIGDGENDDTDAFQKAINSGNPIIIANTYRITYKLNATKENTTIIGLIDGVPSDKNALKNKKSHILIDFEDDYGFEVGQGFSIKNCSISCNVTHDIQSNYSDLPNYGALFHTTKQYYGLNFENLFIICCSSVFDFTNTAQIYANNIRVFCYNGFAKIIDAKDNNYFNNIHIWSYRFGSFPNYDNYAKTHSTAFTFNGCDGQHISDCLINSQYNGIELTDTMLDAVNIEFDDMGRNCIIMKGAAGNRIVNISNIHASNSSYLGSVLDISSGHCNISNVKAQFYCSVIYAHGGSVNASNIYEENAIGLIENLNDKFNVNVSNINNCLIGGHINTFNAIETEFTHQNTIEKNNPSINGLGDHLYPYEFKINCINDSRFLLYNRLGSVDASRETLIFLNKGEHRINFTTYPLKDGVRYVNFVCTNNSGNTSEYRLIAPKTTEDYLLAMYRTTNNEIFLSKKVSIDGGQFFIKEMLNDNRPFTDNENGMMYYYNSNYYMKTSAGVKKITAEIN